MTFDGSEAPEPELTREERQVERGRLRQVRKARRMAWMKGANDRKTRAKGKQRKKNKKK